MISDVEFLKIAKMPNMKILIQGKQAPITTPSPVPSLDTGLLQEKKKKGKEESQINESTTFLGNLLPNRSQL